MKRRESLKYILVGTIGSTAIGSIASCKTDQPLEKDKAKNNENLYGRTAKEIEHDEKIKSESFLNEHELSTIAVLCDIILPATSTAGSASEAEVPAFIDFIVKDLSKHQLPIRGGLMWLDAESNNRFNKEFIKCTPEEEIQIIEDIAYPDPENKHPEMAHGIKFFKLIRNLTVTGYYTTRMGFDDLGITTNTPNVWDGVPTEVLAQHNIDYEPEWLSKCVDQSKRTVIAEWDEDGNLLT